MAGARVSHGHRLAAPTPVTQASRPDREPDWGGGGGRPLPAGRGPRGSALRAGTAETGRDVHGVLHHGTLALQRVLVHGVLLLLLHSALLIAALVRAAALPGTRAAHHA